MSLRIHSTAVVSPSARLGNNVSVGAYSVIEDGVEVGDDTRIGPHVVIQGVTRIGKNNRIYQFASIGAEPQDKKYAGESSEVDIGSDNVIREFCTINRGTAGGGGKTVIGSRNLIMAYVHIAHDCIVGNDTLLVNGATLGGHVLVGDHAFIGANVMVRQFCRIGRYVFATYAAALTKDVVPFSTAAGNPARSVSLNKEGLKQNGFDDALIRRIDRCYRQLVRPGVSPDNPELVDQASGHPEVRELIDFVADTRYGITKAANKKSAL